jgi:outer membrane lipoprotein SlyB
MAILNLSEYYVNDNTQNKNTSPQLKGGEDLVPINQQYREPLLNGLDSKYVDQAEMDMAKNRMGLSIPALDVKGPGDNSFGKTLGQSAASNAGTILDFASTAVQLNSNVARSDKEANARTGQLALKGAGMGATVGSAFGPLGTAIGAVGGALIGGTVGMLKKTPDRKKRLKADNENYNNRMFAMTQQTNQMATNALIQEELQNQQALTKAQMGLLNLKY